MATARKKAAKTTAPKRPATRRKATTSLTRVATRKKAVKAAPKTPTRKKAGEAATRRVPAPKPGVVKRTAHRLSREAFRLAGVGSDAVARATGKAWDQWLAILDKAGAATMPHKAIAKMLSEKYAVPPWWSQMITVGYEQARGMREAYQKADGYSASVSRTMAAGVERLYGAWADPALRSLWLGAAPVVVTRSRDGTSMNMAWTAGGSRVEVNFTPQGAGKSKVAVQHEKLPDREAVLEKKGFWAGALGRLKALLEKAA
jgi:uncharacterized protein YndB with AHSA1/START domain